MPATKTQLIGGAFQDSEGNVLNGGYLLLKLNQDNSVSGVGNIAAGVEVKITLNSSGNVDTSTPQYIWATDVMSVPNAFYRVTGYTAKGQPAWGPNNQQVVSGGVGGGTFDTGLWVPNSVFSWVPPVQPLTLKTNGTLNGSQTLLNIAAGANLSATDNGLGTVTLAVTGITGITLKTNGTLNGSQTLLNLVNGNGIGITQDGAGNVTVATSLVAGTGISITGTSTLTISASSSVASGKPIMLQNAGSRGFIVVAAAFVGSNVTLIQGFTGSALVYPNLGQWKISINNQSSAFTMDSANVAQVTPGTGNVVSTAVISFGGVSTNMNIASGLNTSDAISMVLDPAFDYYVRLRVSGGGGNLDFYQAGSGYSFPGGFSSIAGSHESDNPISLGAPNTTFTQTGGAVMKIISA